MTDAFTPTTASNISDTEKFGVVQKQVSRTIFSALGDQNFRVVRSVLGKPVEMLENFMLDTTQKSTASKITKMSELVSVRYTNPKADISKLIDFMPALLEQLKAMEAKMDDSLAVGILIVSIDVHDFKPVVAAIKTLSDAYATWETVSERLVDEFIRLKKGKSSAAASSMCEFCTRLGHCAEKCLINPENPGSRLKAMRSSGRPSKEISNKEGSWADSDRKKIRRNKKNAECAAIQCAIRLRLQTVCWYILGQR